MDIVAASQALEPIRQLLAPDGYELHVDESTDTALHLRVVAGPDACADCLVPKDVFSMIVRDNLPEGVDEIVVDYPADATH